MHQKLTAQGAQLDQSMRAITDNILSNGGCLHVILDVMVPPELNILGYIRHNTNLTQLAKAIQVAEVSHVFTGTFLTTASSLLVRENTRLQ